MTAALPISGLLEQFDNFKGKYLERYAAWRSLSAWVTVQKRLDEWHYAFLTTMPYHARLLSNYLADDEQSTFPNLTVANGLTHYWAFRILCAAYIRQLQLLLPELAPQRAHAPQMINHEREYRESSVQMSNWILQNVDFFLLEDMKLFGSNSLLLPLKVAYDCIKIFGTKFDLAFRDTVLKNMDSKGYGYLTTVAISTPTTLRGIDRGLPSLSLVTR